MLVRDGWVPYRNVAFLHDPLALASVHDEGFCRFEDLHVRTAVQDASCAPFRAQRKAP